MGGPGAMFGGYYCRLNISEVMVNEIHSPFFSSLALKHKSFGLSP